MAMAEWRTIGRGAAILGAAALTYWTIDNGIEYAAGAFNWAAGSGTVPYLNSVVHSTSGFLDKISEVTGIGAGAYAGYKTRIALR